MGLSAMGALFAVAWSAYQVGATVKENRADVRTTVQGARTGLSDVFSESRDVTIALLKPCKPGKPETCGLIPAVRDVATDTGSAVEQMSLQVQSTQPLLQTAAASITDVSSHLNTAIDAATQTTLQAQGDLGTLNGSILASRGLLEAYTQSGNTLNELLNRPAIPKIIDNAAGITGSAADMLAIGDQVEAKATHDYLHPSKNPWVRDWKATYPWLLIGAQAGVKFAPVVP